MTRVYRFAVFFTVWTFAAVMHLFISAVFSPANGLFQKLASSGTILPASHYAQLYYEIGSIWIPFMAAAGITLWLFYLEYSKIVATEQRPVR